MANDMNDTRDNMRKQAEEIEKQQRVAAAEQKVEDLRALAKEQREFADNAMARGGGGITVEQPDAEAERTRILAEEAERKLAEAEEDLKNVKADKQPSSASANEPAPPNPNSGASNRAATTTRNVDA